MITIIVRWESVQMAPSLEHRMWRQLKGAYTEGDSANFRLIYVPRMEGIGAEQYDTMEEALEHVSGQVCFLEPNGERCVTEIKEKDITLIIGNTENSNMQYATPETAYKIKTPKNTDMYGVNAGAIALSHWWYNRCQ